MSGEAPPFEFHFQADGFERFRGLERRALAGMDAECEEAECADQGQPAANPGV